MWKYRNQTLVSVAGLAVGFVCFAMSALWIRYEMTYDSFHKNADRMYCINREDYYNGKVITSYTPRPLAEYLKSTFPEIAHAAAVHPRNINFKYEGVGHKADILDIFFKEYLTLLAVGALIAFPAGYVIMKRWLEQYVIQTEMSAWIYLSILLALFMVIVMCVGGRVYRTSRENPVNALNK
jgi:hypothetical protein